MRRSLRFLAAVIVVALIPALPVNAGDSFQTPNVRVVAQHRYMGGTEIAFSGDLIFAGQNNARVRRGEFPGQGGIKIFRTTHRRFSRVGTLRCAGTDNDVVVVRPGIIAVAHHQSACNPATRSNGIFLADVSNPARPRVLGGVSIGSAHTLTVHPSGDYIYVNPGGLANGGGLEEIVDVRDPAAPFVESDYLPNMFGCHDLQFHPTEPLAYCAGLGEVQVWDVSDPIAPRTVHHVLNPAIQFAHNAVVSPGGRWLVVNDEAFGLHECDTDASLFGSLWIYDLSVPDLPIVAGRIAPPAVAGSAGGFGWIDEWCTAHNYNFLSDDVIASSWFTGGTRIHDISDPLMPVELATYRPADAIAYTAHWYGNRVYVNDAHRGMEVLEIDLPAPAAADASNAPPPPTGVDRTHELIPEELPARRPFKVPTLETTFYCVLPTPEVFD
ncbi:MAG: hypothetical protein KY395_06720 [Actinobacteria bacterium]|nr:hypothetical protein [Actinomycetota bacterium]